MPHVLSTPSDLVAMTESALSERVMPEVDTLLARFDSHAQQAAQEGRRSLLWTHTHTLQAVRDAFEEALAGAGYTLEPEGARVRISWHVG